MSMAVEEWHARSFLIELKPRAELASLFVDCPPPDEPNSDRDVPLSTENTSESSTKDEQSTELVKVSEHRLELGQVEGTTPQSTSSQARFSAHIVDLCLHPTTVCALTWADHRRLFMCKVHAEADGLPLVPKTFHRLAKEIADSTQLDEYAENARPSAVSLECTECSLPLFKSDPGKLELQSIPEDDWLDTSPSMEYFCRDSCSHSHHHPTHLSDLANGSEQQQWTPSQDRFLLAHSFTLILKQTLTSNVARIDDTTGIVKCAQCSAELGIVYRRNTTIVKLHHSVTKLRTGDRGEPYIDVRFGGIERYFAWMLLSQCETQTSLKLVIRSYDKRPYLLIWLLESYVVLTSGDLQEQIAINGNGKGDIAPVRSFPALKMLYKVFDAESAKSDPRANGEDASVGLVDVPVGCCLTLIQVLLSSSHALPPACRAVGQFYVGFMKLKDGLE